jgi:shikimate 5-dehydrogenase
MSNVVQKILQKMNLNYKLYSRKLIPNFSDLNLSTYKSQAVLINCCTRDFVFKGNIPDNISIFDLNYGETPFISYCLKNNLELLDGRELFELQAFYASDILRKELLVE